VDTVTLGRTGLTVSVAGLGCGGPSRLGRTAGATEDESVAVVRRALDLGITFFDTARAYGTEEVVAKGLGRHRDDVVISTKSSPRGREGPLSKAALRESVDKSLQRLATDRIDVFHLHGVVPDLYDHCISELVPVLSDLRDEGKVRFLAISEQFGGDPGHAMLQRAVKDDCWDVMMVGFHLLNASARQRVFVATRHKGIGVLVMFAVRRTLSRPDELRKVMRELVDEGHVPASEVDVDDPLAFLLGDGGAESVVEAAYRFARHDPGTDVVLTGTGNVAHLEENVAALNKAPLPEPVVARLDALFGRIDHITGN